VRLRSLVVIVVVATAALLAPLSGSSSAAGRCSVVTPTKLVIQEIYREVPVRLSSNCAAADRVYALWNVVHAKGITDFLEFEANTVDEFGLSWPGRYTVQPVYAWDSQEVWLEQNTAYVIAKCASRVTATTSRAGGKLTFDAYARFWSSSYNEWQQRPGANVSLMRLAPGATSWTWVKYATTDRAGRVHLSVVPQPGSYRLMIKETDRIWASYSATVAGA
jgi:hypothetical protein